MIDFQPGIDMKNLYRVNVTEKKPLPLHEDNGTLHVMQLILL